MKIYKSYFIYRFIRLPTFLLYSFILFTAPVNAQLNNQTVHFSTKYVSVIYNDLNNWAAHPWKNDPSDRVPAPLQATHIIDSTVDVFFIHPTTYTQKKFDQWNANLSDSNLNDKTDNSSILYQASVFNESNRVFAPRYRQAHLQAFYLNDSVSAPYFDTAYADIKSAFEFYLQQLNKGRPIIVASHSQGTMHAGRLLKEFFEGTLLANKLVCAYLIGMPIPETYFTQLKPCTNPTATGCFVGWRTFKSGYQPGYIEKENFKSVVVNPLTWTINDSLAPAELNKGGILTNFNKVVPEVVSAQIHENVLWTSKPDVPGKILFLQKNYHVGDINLFYMNIRENVKTRIGAFWKY